MKMNYVEDIREEFRRRKRKMIRRADTIDIPNAVFRVDAPTVFGERNTKYINSEIAWYISQSLNVEDLYVRYGKKVQIWEDVSDSDGYINSNYGWCVYSSANGRQFLKVREKLQKDPYSRQAVMIYTRPTMHIEATHNGMKDFMCTNYVAYSITGNYLEAAVHMRSNDAIYGFINDYAWQQYVLRELAEDLQLVPGPITWHADSFHIYERHYDLIV